ncbi:MAG: hypothetical protein AAF985_15355 [Bacteroidota bacterium]
MTKGDFFYQLSFLTLGLGLMLTILHQFPAFQTDYQLSILSCLFFVFFSIVIYMVGYSAAQSSEKHLFTNVIVTFVFSKMLLSIVLVIAYHRLVEPSSNLFLIPFFVIYLFYTIFETHFMIKLGKVKPQADRSLPKEN